MYAIIRTGGKQTKVRVGDVVDVERLRADDEVTFTPVLVVDGKGKVYSRRGELASAVVTAKVLGESAGDKVDIFKYKAKTGYRRRAGHRQRYTRIEVTKIQGPKPARTQRPSADAEEPAVESATTEAVPAKASAAKGAAKEPAAKKPAAKAAAKEPAAKKPAAKKPGGSTGKATSAKDAEESAKGSEEEG